MGAGGWETAGPLFVFVMKFLDCGDSEHVKAGFHAAIGTLLVGALAYNLAAYCHRTQKDKRLLTNAIIYGAGVGLEVVQTLRHVQTIRAQR